MSMYARVSPSGKAIVFFIASKALRSILSGGGAAAADGGKGAALPTATPSIITIERRKTSVIGRQSRPYGLR